MLPDGVREAYDLLDVRRALELDPRPRRLRRRSPSAQRRFRFEEALVTQLVLARRRRAVRELGARARTGDQGGLLAAFDARLPFELTAGQREIGAEIEQDLAEPHPMNRLLQGEVGSGKTLVALRAMLRVVDSGGQAALLAPTEVLAQQHHRSITALLGDLAAGGMLGGAADATNVELLTGSMTKAQRTAPMSRIATGEAGIVIGTHALLEERVIFADLGLVVVDEQHRFGVEQRAALTDKAGTPPHVLVMTATPIPRTVAMTVFGDLETSTLTELPAGRAPIQTNVVPLADQPQLDRPGLAAGARGGREGPPGLRRVPAHHRRRAGAGRERPARPRRGRRHRRHRPARRRGSAPSRRSPPSWPRARCTGCASSGCTASCRPTTRTG